MRALFVSNVVTVSLCALLVTAAEGYDQHKKKDGKPEANVQQWPKLPEGIIHVQLPPGQLRIDNIIRDDKPILRVTVGKTVIETRSLFLGNDKGATQYEATKEGLHWVRGIGGKGNIVGIAIIQEPGSAINDEDFVPLNK